MNQKFWITAAIVVTLALASVAHVLAQTNQPQGHWLLVASNGGDGAVAWKFNPDTGQSYFCYRHLGKTVLTTLPPTKQ
jgi:hypothetical protein